MTYYETLNLDISASIEDIKKQYKILSKKHHPDTGGRHEDFIKIKKAYDYLIENYIDDSQYYNYDIYKSVDIDISTIYSNEEHTMLYTRFVDTVLVEEHLTITNTFTIKPNTQAPFVDYGNIYKNKTGVLYVSFNVKEKHGYERRNKNLYVKLPIEIDIAINGGKVEYKHIDDKIYEIAIPPKVNNKHLLKMSNMGMMYKNQNQRGDLILELELYINYEK
jgi:DnaJ-class molecular chaperone